jgi:hypothetical protein
MRKGQEDEVNAGRIAKSSMGDTVNKLGRKRRESSCHHPGLESENEAGVRADPGREVTL